MIIIVRGNQLELIPEDKDEKVGKAIVGDAGRVRIPLKIKNKDDILLRDRRY